MVKKISFSIFAIAILVFGYIAFNKLNYWERSVRIFSTKNQIQNFEGRRGRVQNGNEGFGDRGGRDGFERPAMHELPDSIRARLRTEGRRQIESNRNTTDSLRQRGGRITREINGRGRFEAGMRNGQGRGRGEFPGGKEINLKNILWFLAVFASFTVAVIYFDKAYRLIRKRKLR